jgi:branched-chain amino acid transport system permease protein
MAAKSSSPTAPRDFPDSARRHLPSLKGPFQTVATLAAVYLALRVLMRTNEPPIGIYIYGAALGLLYALLAFGLILIYRANRVINFAQAEMGAVGGVLAVLLIKLFHVGYLPALAVALLSGLALGAVIEVTVVRRLSRAPGLSLTVATIGVGLVLAAVQLLLPIWMGVRTIDPTPPSTPLSQLRLVLGGFHFDANLLVIPIWVAGLGTALNWFFRHTDLGLAIRGSAENRDRAELLGIPVAAVSTAVWAIAGLLSALSMFLRIPVVGLPIGVLVGPQIVLFGLTAAVFARMESFRLALVASLALGVLEQSIYFYSRDPGLAAALLLPAMLLALVQHRRSAGRADGEADVAAPLTAGERDPRPASPAGRGESRARPGGCGCLGGAGGRVPVSRPETADPCRRGGGVRHCRCIDGRAHRLGGAGEPWPVGVRGDRGRSRCEPRRLAPQ